MNGTYEKILEYVLTLPLIDSHEHVAWREEYREKNTDILNEYLYHYIDTEMMSAGMSWEERLQVIDTSRPLMERWKICEPYWNLVRNTGHARSLDLAVQALYGAPRIDGNTIEGLNEQFMRSLNGGQYQKVFKELSNIEYAVLDVYSSSMDIDRKYFRGVFHIECLQNPCSGGFIDELEKKGVTFKTLDDWLAIADAELNEALKNGAVGFKSAIAYSRPICFGNPTKAEAEESLKFVLARRKEMSGAPNPCAPETRALEDFMMHRILKFAEEHGLVMQIHTGAQGPNWRRIPDTDPSLLFSILAKYPGVKFDLLHSGYPYHAMTGAISQMYPNAFIDMAWTHMMNPEAAVNMLHEWLGHVPANKIIGFGGDYALVDGICGHQLLARRNVSRTLARKVDEGSCDMDMAKWLAHRILYANGRALYGE